MREEKLWGNDNPLFPASRVALGSSKQFAADRGQQKDIDRAKALLQEYKMRKKPSLLPAKPRKVKR